MTRGLSLSKYLCSKKEYSMKTAMSSVTSNKYVYVYNIIFILLTLITIGHESSNPVYFPADVSNDVHRLFYFLKQYHI